MNLKRIIFISYSLYFFTSCNNNKTKEIFEFYGIDKKQFEFFKKNKIDLIPSLNKRIENIDLYDITGKKIELKNFLNVKEKILVKFSSLECSDCIEHIVKSIKLVEQDIEEKKIMFLGYFHNDKEFLTFKKLNIIDYKVLKIAKNNLDLPTDYLNEPYIILIDSTLKIKRIFVPNRTNPKRTYLFFKNILNK